jgi:hypothetical protein
MASIMALGLGSMFLTQMNLQIAENTRSNAVAKYNAEAGVDTATVLLTERFEALGKTFPATWNMPATATYRLFPNPDGSDNGYVRYTATNQARVRVEGFTPNNARYVAEILLGSASTINPAFEIGIASMGTVRITGGGNAEFINAGIHGNTGNELPGYSTDRFRSCPIGVTFANCPVVFDRNNYNQSTYNPYNMPGPYLPVTSSNGTNCYMTPWCRNQEEVISVDVGYTSRRNDQIAISLGFVTGQLDPNGQPLPLYFRNAQGQRVSDGMGGFLYAHPSSPNTSVNINPETNPTIYDGRCTVVYSTSNPPPATITTVATGARICARNGLSLNFATGINMTGATVVADGNITFGGATNVNGTAGNLTDTRLISRTRLNPTANDSQGGAGQGGVMLDTVRGHNLTIFSGANRNITSNLTTQNNPPQYLIGSGFNLTGNTTIASNREVSFAGQTQITTYPTDPTRAPEVTVAIISSRRIVNSGSSDFYGIFWAGMGFAQSGSGKIYGAVVSQGDITSTGNFHINSSYAVNNSSLYAPPEATVMSRR